MVKSIPEVPMRTKLQPGETVALTVRKHWIVLAKPALFFLVVLFSFPFRHVKLAGFEALLSYLFPYLLAMSAGLLLYRYFDRKVNIWTVTTLRLIDEWGIVTHRSKENPLDKINDIVVEQTIAGRIFNYGSISVQTAATAGETVIDFVERPKDLKQTINGQKALRSEREEKPGSMRNVHGRQSMTVAQTVLFHESLKPPFSLRCPYCDGEIVIDYARAVTPRTSQEDRATEEVDQRQEDTQEGAEVVATERSPQASIVAEREPRVAGPDAMGDPFGWKRHAR